MRLFLFIVFFVALSIEADAQKQFPQAYYGKYLGNLHIANPNGNDTIDMEFHLRPTDSAHKHHYTIIYIMDTLRQERNYTLIQGKIKNRFTIDENNGIILSATFVDNTLYSVFEVQGGLLTTTERFFDDYMIFEITYAAKSQIQTSGGTSEDIPEVLAYPISTVQKAKLIKE